MPAGFYNGSIMFADNVRFDGQEQPGQVTSDGQLLIGSTASPNIKIGTLSSSDNSITVTNGSGTIDLKSTFILQASITLTSTQIKNLNATPITIVPAQGAGKVIIPYSATLKFIYGGTNVFVAGAGQSVSLAYNTSQIAVMINDVRISASASSYQYTSSFTAGNSYSFATIENAPLVAYNPIATEISGNAANNNSMIVNVQYYVLSI